MVLVKFLTSVKWQARFEEITEEFDGHQTGIQFDLQIQASIGITTMNNTLSSIHGDIKAFMAMVFEQLRSSEERELAAFVSAKGGLAEVLASNDLLEATYAKVKSRDEKRQANPKGLSGRRSLRDEIKQEVDQIIAENQEFSLKFEAMRVQLEEVKETVKHESDRVIDAVFSGPHDRIIDRVQNFPHSNCASLTKTISKDIHHVWKEMVSPLTLCSMFISLKHNNRVGREA